MTPTEVLNEARRLGVELSVTERGQLRWRCQGPLPPALRQPLAAHKTGLLALLQQATAGADTVAIERGGEGKTEKTDACHPVRKRAACPDFAVSLEAELLLEKKLLEDKIRTCHDPDLRRRLAELRQEQPPDLEAALAWYRRLLALQEAWRSDQAVFENARAAWGQAEADRLPSQPPALATPGPAVTDNQTIADELVAQLRAEIIHIERTHYGGRFTPAAANIAADGLAIAEGYIRNWDAEVSRGWEPMELLRAIARALPKQLIRGAAS